MRRNLAHFRQWFLRVAAAVVLLFALALLFWLRHAIYHRVVQFPREEAAWQALRAQRQPVTNSAGWSEFRGICHSHSELSHDCQVPFEEILRVLQATGIDFICLSDHCVDGRADFNSQWRGVHDGKLFIPGFEMKEGLMPFGLASNIVLTNSSPAEVLARETVTSGGVLFYAHPEELRDWNRPELTGMEIYNLHSDFKHQKHGLAGLLPDLMLNWRRYPDHVLYQIFRRPTEFLRRWDELNRSRHITGIAGNDCHQNVGIRGFYTAGGNLRVEDTSPKLLREFRLNWLTRLPVRLLLGPAPPRQELFHLQLDPYERSGRYVNTHVLARELSEAAVVEALRAGRVFVAFDLIADSTSFRWFAEGQREIAVMGERQAYSPSTRLHARSPVPCRFTLWKDGKLIQAQEGRSANWAPPGSGKYRVEAELRVRNDWVPWVYANPIELD